MGKSVLDKKTITREQLQELARVSRDPFLFSKYVKVVHPVRGTIPFNLYPYQESCLYQFLKYRFNIVLKFRQGGLTELISMFCLWLAMYHDHKKINIISIKDTTAKKVLKKIKFMYKNLPWYLQTPITNGRMGDFGSVNSIEFSNGSLIESLPTSENAGRSESLSLLVIDEAAAVRWAGQVFASALPTVSTGGSVILNSTPLGTNNFYHKTWVDAVQGVNVFNPIRLYWRMHPERDQEWYDTMFRALGPKRTAQEIDGDFLSSGNTVFDMADIIAIEQCLNDWTTVRTLLKGQYRQFNEVDPNKEYFIGADCATGRGTDYSAFSVMDRDGEDQACFKGRIPLNKYARLLGDIGEHFNFAKLAPETNDIGAAVTMQLQDEGYPHLYQYQKLIRKKGTTKPDIEEVPGWLTTSKNRSVIIEGLEKDIREDEVVIKDPFFTNEAHTFIYDATGRPVAMGKHRLKSNDDIGFDDETYSDDSIFGKAITNHIRKQYGNTSVVLPY